MRRWAALLMVAFALLRPSVGIAQAGDSRVQDWSTMPDTIGSPGSVTTYMSAPEPSIAYHFPTASDLIYTERVSGSWVHQPVDVVGDVGKWPSLKRDPMGVPHISYYDATNGRLKYARRPTVTWIPEFVDPASGVGPYNAITTSSSAVYISYYDVANGNLKVATRPLSGGPWTIEVADAPGDVGRYTSIVESGGVVAVAYYDATNGDLKFTRRLMMGWQTETVDSPGNVGRFTSMVQVGGDYAVSYYDIGNGALKVATRVSGVWTIQTVDDADNVGEYSSLVAGGPSVTDQLEVAYYDRTNANLKFARKLGSWIVETLDLAGDVGRACSMASAGPMASDSIGIAYHDVSQPGLKWFSRKNPVVAVEGGPRADAGARLWCSPGIGGAAQIHYRLASPGPVTLAVRDLMGREVSRLEAHATGSGEQVEVWGQEGARPSGIYFVSLTHPGGRLGARLLLIR